MWEQEKAHLQLFDKLVKERRVRPTALMPLWDVLAYGLGEYTITARLTGKLKWACPRVAPPPRLWHCSVGEGGCNGMYSGSGGGDRRAL